MSAEYGGLKEQESKQNAAVSDVIIYLSLPSSYLTQAIPQYPIPTSLLLSCFFSPPSSAQLPPCFEFEIYTIGRNSAAVNSVNPFVSKSKSQKGPQPTVRRHTCHSTYPGFPDFTLQATAKI